jgi:Arc/MetJ-type ribon-helix-helix transcriptional regulator
MSKLIHIRVGKELKKQMDALIEKGYFSNQAELAREGIRKVLLAYKDELKEEKKK